MICGVRALKTTIMGIGFLIVAFALLTTNVAGGSKWWWAMLFPAFSLLASGIGSIAKSKRLEKENFPAQPQTQPTLFAQPPTNASLPPSQTNYVKPQGSIYDTGELVAPAEHRRRHNQTFGNEFRRRNNDFAEEINFQDSGLLGLSKCGLQNADNAKFCRSCGADLSNVLAVVEGKLPDRLAEPENHNDLTVWHKDLILASVYYYLDSVI